jgi:hypothetical protein
MWFSQNEQEIYRVVCHSAKAMNYQMLTTKFLRYSTSDGWNTLYVGMLLMHTRDTMIMQE